MMFLQKEGLSNKSFTTRKMYYRKFYYKEVFLKIKSFKKEVLQRYF